MGRFIGKKSQRNYFIELQSSKILQISLFLLLLIIIPSIVFYSQNNRDPRGRAQTINNLEAENGQLFGNATIGNDTLASNGKFIQLGTTSPTPTILIGKQYFVDCLGGSDTNNGTSSTTAWKTLSKANTATILPGESLLLKKSCTWTGPLTAKWQGTAEKPILISSYGGGDIPKIQNTTTNSNVQISGTYQIIENIYTRSDAPSVDNNCQIPNNDRVPQKVGYKLGFELATGAMNNTIRNAKATELSRGVYISQGASKNKIINNHFLNNTMMSRLTVGGDDDSGAMGIDVQGDENEIAYNIIEGQIACSYDYTVDGSAIEIYGGQRNTIHHNTSRSNLAFTELGNPKSADNTFAYNIVTSSLSESVFLNTRGGGNFGPVLRTKAYNNTVFLTGDKSQGVICTTCSAEVLTLKNNILIAGWKSIYASAPFNESNNIYWREGGSPFVQLLGGAVISSSSMKVDPQFISTFDFHLKTTSPAIDKGSNESVTAGFKSDFDGKAVPQGNGVNIGAYE
jgi:hypothetical protein